MELADCDLFDKMKNIYPKIISASKTAKYFKQIASAIDYLHN